MHPACNTHAPYCHLWPVWLYHIFQQRARLPQKAIENRTVFGFPLQHFFLRNILILRKIQQDNIKMYKDPHIKYPPF
jgi:hypothetical protein